MRFERLLVTSLCFASLTSLAVLVGCGSKSDMAPVQGLVTVDGKPVAGAQVLFVSSNHRPAAGETDAEGRYVLSTFETGDGASIGTYAVTVTARPTIRVSAAGSVGPPTGRQAVQHGAKSPVPLKYSDAANPLISVEVKPGDNDIPLELKQN
ncbi:MAG: hypothetical protein AB7G28_06605 [Pirellulales bacterium]